jgi:hypothetical protein
MANKKSFWIMLGMVLALGLVLAGCDNGTTSGNNGNGGGVQLPANLQNTKWKPEGGGEYYYWEFGTTTITRTTAGADKREYKVKSAVEDGKIEEVEDDGYVATLCTKYTVTDGKWEVWGGIAGGNNDAVSRRFIPQ